MKWFFKSKDGGPESNVTGYWLVESKSLFSIVLLRFDNGTREAFHNHAFNAVSWILKGMLYEVGIHSSFTNILTPSIIPIYTSRERMHRVYGVDEKTWVLSFRGPWNKTWREYSPEAGTYTTLTNGRKVVNEQNSNYRQST